MAGMISKLYRIQGSNIMKAITAGRRMVQQNDISWSYRIRGKLARTQINRKIIAQALRPRVRPYIAPSTKGSEKKLPDALSAVARYRYGSTAFIRYRT